MTGAEKRKVGAGQDPHRVAPIGSATSRPPSAARCAALRQNQRITVKELSDETGLSIGMLSKIENGVTSPSLTTLQSLARALNVPLTALFRQFEERREAVHTKAGEGAEIVREGTRAGHQYNLLGHLAGAAHGVTVEPYLITLTSASDVFPTFQHDGVEVIYMLEGVVGYRHGQSSTGWNPATRCSSTPTRPTGRRNWRNCRSASCR
jgi:transcriptional regulator with XRE-family HTH domain